MPFQNIIFSVKDRVATITLNSPGNLNAFNEIMIREVLAALCEAEKDEQVRVIVMNAKGKAFSGGGDINEMFDAVNQGKQVFDVTVALIARVSCAIRKSAKPVIASVNGAVAGAAFNIALACDFCIATEQTKFIQAFIKIGLIPDAGGLFLLSRAVGVNKATHLAMLGTPVDAIEAEKLGFVYRVCSPAALDSETELLAQKLTAGPAKAYARIKELIFASEFAAYAQYTEKEIESQLACGNTNDFKEGIRAFVEKRQASFTGK